MFGGKPACPEFRICRRGEFSWFWIERNTAWALVLRLLQKSYGSAGAKLPAFELPFATW